MKSNILIIQIDGVNLISRNFNIMESMPFLILDLSKQWNGTRPILKKVSVTLKSERISARSSSVLSIPVV